ncbi:hypothetical protein LSCM4_04058 [Leishmania orientalis]|uniref:Conserved oligomeric Golgi complex subunit 8 n=1 Tax=Leishmania orientalis TaxID=2249476 RepID=A0A836GLZ3_9TRYP|nr:hypothetical protein LSCM4_04058 [Leishmania orientalis]
MTIASAEEARVRQSIVNCAVDHYQLLTNAQAANAAAASLTSSAEEIAKGLTASLRTLHSWSQLLQYAGQSWRQEKAQLHSAVISHQKIVALMESPALLTECVRYTMFHEALLIFEHVMLLCQQMSDVCVFQRLQKEMADAMEQAVDMHVLPMLSGALTVDTAYKAISLLRRLGGTPASLRALFLRSRAAYIRQLLQEAESSVVPYSLILKYITVYKVHVNEATLQYKACFPANTESQQRETTEELSLWCQEQAHMFMYLMAAALQHLHNGSELALVVQQCSSCASACARAHTDVLGLLGSILIQKVQELFADGMRQARTTYRTAMQTSSWRVSVYCHNNTTLTSSTVIKALPTVGDTPAVQLAQWLPLAYALNGILSSFNAVRKCLLPGAEASCGEQVGQLVCEVAQDMLNDAPLLDTMYGAERDVFVTFVKAFRRLWYPYVLHLVGRLLGPAHREDLEERTQALVHGIEELLFAVEPPPAGPAAESALSSAPAPAHPHPSTSLAAPIVGPTAAPVATPPVPPTFESATL